MADVHGLKRRNMF